MKENERMKQKNKTHTCLVGVLQNGFKFSEIFRGKWKNFCQKKRNQYLYSMMARCTRFSLLLSIIFAFINNQNTIISICTP